MYEQLTEEIDDVLDVFPGIWEDLRGAAVFVTGGTGFFGCWLLRMLLRADSRFSLGATATVLTRNALSFEAKAPDIFGNPKVRMVEGDVGHLELPGTPRFSHVIHAAADTRRRRNDEDPVAAFDTIVEGTRRVLDHAVKWESRSVLFASSGAVYGRQRPEVMHQSEEGDSGPDQLSPTSTYAEAKRAAELLCAIYAERSGVPAKIARCYAFVGPGSPLDEHFAIGNFIRDGLVGGPIRVNGDGTPFRSYLYASDLSAWLWTIMVRGIASRAYNVGSEDGISIVELAHAVAAACPGSPDVVVARSPLPGVRAERYVPSTRRAREELGVRQTVGLEEAIARTVRWVTDC